jgi:4-hydroxy-2-oxoheptanedioate aldolase
MQPVTFPKNILREKIKSRGYAIGTCVYSFSPDLVQIAGYSGMDFCRIDNEHAWRQDNSLENMIRAGKLSNTAVLARVDRDNPYTVRKALELGPDALVIPQIKNKQDVEAYIKWAKFPPLGSRGFSNLNQSAHYGLIDSKEWIEWSNTEILIGVMIETAQAVKEVDSILSTPGLDFVLIGPADLSLSLNLPKPDLNHPLVQESIRTIIDSAKRNKVYTMLGVGFPWEDQARKYLEMGVDMIELGHDYSILGTVWKQLSKAL